MNFSEIFTLQLCCAGVLLLAGGLQAGQDEWLPVRETPSGYLYHRASGDSSPPWTMITASFAAAPERIYAMVTDYDHFPVFVPYVAESRVVRESGDAQWVYHRLHFPGPIADRRYVFVSRNSRPAADYYRVEWELSDEVFPDVDLSRGVRPQSFSGFWEIQAGRDAGSTQARYAVHSDPGGMVPGWLVSSMTDRYAGQVVQAIRQRLAGEQ